MAGLSHKEVAEVLAKIAAKCAEPLHTSMDPLLCFSISNILADFFEDKTDGFAELYDRRLMELSSTIRATVNASGGYVGDKLQRN